MEYTQKDLFPEWTFKKRTLWKQIEDKPNKTEEERRFCNSMYHIEEGISDWESMRDYEND